MVEQHRPAAAQFLEVDGGHAEDRETVALAQLGARLCCLALCSRERG